jgi:hypothetical protein
MDEMLRHDELTEPRRPAVAEGLELEYRPESDSQLNRERAQAALTDRERHERWPIG